MALITVWRIVDKNYLGSAFSGIGAELYGGRFNSIGNRVVYASETISLAVLEMLVQGGNRRRLSNHVCLSATINKSFAEIVDLQDLPSDWDAKPHGRMTQTIGDAWLREKRSLVLQVPSVVVPQEHNYLINPAHEKFSTIKIGDPFHVPFDKRLHEEQ